MGEKFKSPILIEKKCLIKRIFRLRYLQKLIFASCFVKHCTEIKTKKIIHLSIIRKKENSRKQQLFFSDRILYFFFFLATERRSFKRQK